MKDRIKISNNAIEDTRSFNNNYINKTGKYDLVVKKAYLLESKTSNSIGVFLELANNSDSIIERLWISDKEGNTFKTVNGKDIENFNFTKLKKLNFLLTGIENIPYTEKRKIKLDVWDEEKKSYIEKTVEKEVLTEFINKPITVLLKKYLYCQEKFNPNTNQYEPTEHYKKVMKIEHFLDPTTNRTAKEIKEGLQANLVNEWLAKNTPDVVVDKRKDICKNKETAGTNNVENENKGSEEENPFA